MLTVAIGAEGIDYDAEIYRTLLEMLLGTPIARYPPQVRFGGWKNVLALAETYLRDAHSAGVKHALFAIDNDGKSTKHLEHHPAHDAAAEAADESGCRTCLLAQALPGWWTANAGKRCVVVPVQTLETWLLCIRGDDFSASPEQQYHRDVLKKRFFGRPLPPAPVRLSLALAEISKPGALDILRQRLSFRQFEAQLADWR